MAFNLADVSRLGTSKLSGLPIALFKFILVACAILYPR